MYEMRVSFRNGDERSFMVQPSSTQTREEHLKSMFKGFGELDHVTFLDAATKLPVFLRVSDVIFAELLDHTDPSAQEAV